MPKIDFDKHEEPSDYSPIPEGEYLVEVEKVEERSTNAGDEMWSLTFAVVEGEYAGRKVWDNMVFSEAAMGRVKLICSRMGLSVKGEVDLKPSMLMGRRVIVDTYHEEYEDNDGNTKTKSSIPFAGYTRPEDGGEPSSSGSSSSENGEEGGGDDDDLPF